MAFTVKNWQDAPSTATPLSAVALEDLETRLAAYSESAAGNTAVIAATGTSATDSAAVYTALNAAKAAGGGRVIATRGTYLLNTHQGGAPTGSGGNPRSVLYLTAANNVTLELLPGAVFETTVTDPATILEVRDSTNFTVTGRGKWVGNANIADGSNANVRGSAVRYTNVTHGVVEGNEFTNFGYSAIYITAGASYCVISGNYLHDFAASGHGINEDSFPATGTYVSPGVHPVGNLITGNRLENIGGFAIAADSPESLTFTRITDNFIDGTQSYAGIKANSGDTLVEGNEIRNTNWQGIDAGGSGNLANIVRRLVIRGNTLVNCGNTLRGDISDYSSGIWIQGSSTSAPENITVENNVIDGPGKHGIYALDITGLRVLNNTITGTLHSGHGVYALYDVSARNGLQISGNRMKTIAGAGVLVTSTVNTVGHKGGQIHQNYIEACVDGIAVRGQVQDRFLDYQISGNTVIDCTGVGYQYDATRLLSTNNLVDATSAVNAIKTTAGVASRVWSYGDLTNGTFSGGGRADNSAQMVWVTPDANGIAINRAGVFAVTTFALESVYNIKAGRSFISPRQTQTLAANGAVTIDATLANYHDITLQANATSSTITFSFSTAGNYSGQEMTIAWRQDGTGSRTYAWPTNCKFAGATAPTASTAGGRIDAVTFRFDGTNWNEIARSVNIG